MNTSTKQTNAARDAGQGTQITVRDRTGNIISPDDPDYDMMKAKQESRERRAGAHIGLLATPAPSTYNRARAICSCRHHAFPCAKCEALKPRESTEDRDAILAEMLGPCGASEEIARIALRTVQDEALGLRIALVDAQKRIASLRAERTAYQTAARAWKDEVTALRACAERLDDYVEWHKGAIPSSERDDYEREYLIEGSESLIALAGKGDK